MMSISSFPWYLVQASSWLLAGLLLYALLRMFRVAATHRLAFLELMPWMAFLLPLPELVRVSQSPTEWQRSSIDRFFHKFESFFNYWATDVSWQDFGLAQGILVLYFLVLVPGLYRLFDRCWEEGIHLRNGLLLDILLLLAWFHPLLHVYRLLQVRLKRARPDTAPTWGLSSIGLLLAAVLAPSLPPELPQLAPYRELAYQLEVDLQQTWDRDEQHAYEIQWGSHKLPAQSIRAGSELKYRELHLQPDEFAQLMTEPPMLKLRRDGLRIHLRDVQAYIGHIHNEDLLHLRGEESLLKTLRELRHSREFTIYLRLEPYRGSPQLAVVTVSEAGMLYGAQDALRHLLSEVALVRRLGQQEQLAEAINDGEFHFQWGSFELPLRKLSQANDYSADAEISLDTLEALLEAPMRFTQQGLPVGINSINIFCFDPHSGTEIIRRFSFKPEVEDYQASLRNAQAMDKLREQLRPGFVISIFARLDGININTVNLVAGDPMGLYRPEFRVPEPRHEAPLFSFQIVDRSGFKTLLKIDTSAAENQRILDMYRDPNRYRVQHVPGFRTATRMHSPDPEWMDALRSSGTEYHCTFYTDTLAEFEGHLNTFAQLRWGAMSATPNSEVYSWEQFLANRDQGLQLWLDQKHYTLQRATLYLIREGKPIAFEVLDAKALTCLDKLDLWQHIRPRSTCYLEGLVLLDAEGQERHLPLNFAFTVGPAERDQGYQVSLKTHRQKPAGAPEYIRNHEGMSFRNYPLHLLLTQLLFGLDTLPDSYHQIRLAIQGSTAPLWVDARLVGTGIHDSQARDLLLRELKKRFQFVARNQPIPQPGWQLSVAEHPLLRQAEVATPSPEIERIRRYANGVHELHGFTLQELARYLEDYFGEAFEFDGYFFLYQEERFRFALRFDSLELLRQQLLQEYGVQLSPSSHLSYGWQLRYLGG